MSWHSREPWAPQPPPSIYHTKYFSREVEAEAEMQLEGEREEWRGSPLSGKGGQTELAWGCDKKQRKT